jgi:hypothetical protein
MELITKLENLVGGWLKNVPHLPPAGQKWLGQNVWWIVLIGAIVSGIALLFAIGALFALIALLGAVTASYYGAYAATGVTGLSIAAAIVALAFTIIRVILLAISVKPLKDMQKKGWTLLFIVWLVQVVAVVVGAVLSFNVASFLVSLILGAIGLAISAYFLFEIHAQFAHSPRVTKVAPKKA